MTGWPRTKRTPIGVDLGSHAVKAAQLSHPASQQWCIDAATWMHRDQPDAAVSAEEIARLCTMIDRQGFSGRQVVLAAPRQAVWMDVMTLPPRDSGAPLEQIAQMELARMHKQEAARLQTACWDLPQPARGGEGTHVMVAGCAHETAETLLDLFEQQGMDVLALDCQGWALARACEPLWAEPGRITAIVDVGWSAASLIVLHESTIVYERELADSAMQHIHHGLSEHLQLTDRVIQHLFSEVGLQEDVEEDLGAMMSDARGMMATHFGRLGEQLRAAFGYVAHQYPEPPIGRVLLVGGGAAVRWLDRQLGQTLQLPVQTAVPSQMMAKHPALILPETETTLLAAIGLAQYEKS